MNIAELKGEKTVKTLAKRLLAEPSKDTPKTTQAEMEASLLRLNPQLAKIGDLEKGAAIVVPDGFGLDPEQSTTPLRGLADLLLQRAETALTDLRATLKEQAAQQAERTERVQAWLKDDQAKELGKQSPELKAVFTDAATAVKVLPKEQDATITAETKALDKVAAEVKDFRTTNLTRSATIRSGGITKPTP
jgi:hypothetical protein